MRDINYNETQFLNEDVIFYHKILYGRYMDNLNKLLVKNNYDFKDSKEALVNNLEKIYIKDRDDVLFNLGGVLNHELYFDNINPYNGNIVNNQFLNKINSKYGSLLNFKNVFKNEALKLKGSGYTFLILDRDNDFKIINLSNQDTPISYGFKPIIALDLWEHAYYLQYNINKSDYIDQFLNNLNFNNINKVYLENISK